ncbi:MAG: MotA/TolQ/ExbB proton channel family protein [Phycisphaeraceae bacterium]|nr:MotA/TolQ/ExbB proton channel family protein [Phycisphaeraceae bacterium]
MNERAAGRIRIGRRADLPPDAAAFGGLSGRTAWLAWFAALLGVAGVLAYVHLSQGWASGIVIVIVALFGATLVRSYLDITRLDRETRLASSQARLLRETNDVAEFLAHARPSVFRSHIASLYTIFLANPQIAQDNLIEVTHARLMARNKTVELFASILITLGLIGTIIGLLASASGLDAVLGASETDAEALVDGVRRTVAGLSTAFVTTLFGAIFGGVMLRILTSVVDAGILRYVAHLAELTEVHVLPAMRRTAAKLEATGYYRTLDNDAD